MNGFRRTNATSGVPSEPHAHARMLAAASLDEALTSAESASLAGHLDGCRECRQAALDYAFQGERVHGLPAIEPRRDLAASLAARLDVEEAHRADDRARRAGPRRISWQAHPTARRAPSMLVPAGAGAPFRRPTPAAATVGAGAALSVVAAISLIVAGLPGVLTRPAATPFAIEASTVSWVTREADGRFLVQTASVDRACVGATYGCQGFGAQPTTVVALDMEPASVLIARGGHDAIVIDAGAGGVRPDGGSVYAIQLPAPFPASSVAAALAAGGAAAGADPGVPGSVGAVAPPTGSALAGAAPTGSTAGALLSPAPTRSSRSDPAALALVAGLATATTAAGRTAPDRRVATAAPSAPTIVVGAAASLPSAIPLPTAAATRAIAQDVVLVGGRAAYSPDGRWFAFSAEPADGTAGPDVYVWRVGEATTREITTDHAAVFAGWVGDRLLVSAPDERVRGAGSAPTGIASAVTSPRPSAKPGTRPAATARPARIAPSAGTTAGAVATGRPSSSAKPSASAVDDASATLDAQPPTMPYSYLVDPATRERTPLEPRGLWMPSVDPTGTRVVGWLGTVRVDPATRSWRPADGALVVESWSSVLGGPDVETPAASPAATDAPGTTAAPARSGSPRVAASHHPVETVPPDGTAPALPPEASPEADFGASGHGLRVGVGSTGTGADAPTASPSANEASPSPVPAASGTPIATAAAGGPVTLRVAGLAAIPATWQVGWDVEGTHLAVWVADAGSQEVGKLSVVALDSANAASPKALLSGTPALSAFAMGRGRIAWATPPDATGTGGQVRMLVWSGDSVGQMYTETIHGLETLCGAD